MISQLAVPVVILSLMLLVPGYLVARSLGIQRMLALCTAPIVTIGLVGILGEVFRVAGIAATPISVFAPIVVLPLVLLGVRSVLAARSTGHMLVRDDGVREPGIKLPLWLPAAFVFIGLVICRTVFLTKLDSLDAVMQSYDVTHHLNMIQAFFEAKRISSVAVTSYLTAQDAAIMPYGIVATYPSAWYALCALLMQATPLSAPQAINVSMAVFTAVVLSLGMLAWAERVFADHVKSVFVTALTCVSFVSFPWCLLLFGPLYPNLAGFACIPATAALIMWLMRARPEAERRQGKPGLGGALRARGPYLALLLLAFAGQALLHPNTLFSLFVILVPYGAWRTYRYCSDVRRMELVPSLAAAALFLACCLGFWVLCFRSPAFASIVGEYWPGFAYSWQEVINIVTQTYTMGFFAEITAQVILGILVIIGWVRCVYDSRLRWLAASYLIVAFINFMTAVSSNVTLKQFLSGFWYTDAMRVAAMACIVSMLLAAHGFVWVYELVCGAVSSYNEKRERTTHPVLIAVVLSGLFLVTNFMPGFNWPGGHSPLTPDQFDELKREGREYETMTAKTTFGDYYDLVRTYYGMNKPIDTAERQFLREVARIVPRDALILNDAMDGSFLAYGMEGLRVYYREFGYAGSSTETPESALIREHLHEISQNADVRAAVDKVQAKYVLVMSEQNSAGSFINLRDDYSSSEFKGISSITPYTEGFTPLLTNGTCTLYRID